MNRFSQGVMVIALLVLGVGATLLMMLRPPQAESRPRAEYVPVVRVHEARVQDLSIPVYSQGTVNPAAVINLVAEVSGRVVEIAEQMTDGGFFTAGETLFMIERRPYELEVTRARAAVESARLHVAQAEALAQSSAGIQGLERSPLSLGEPQLRDAESTLEAALAGLELAERQLDRTAVTAPFDGRVRRRLAVVGQFVAPGAPLAEVYAIDIAEVRLAITDSQAALLPDLNQPQPVDRFPALEITDPVSGAVWTGQVVRAEGEIDVRNRLRYVVGRIEDPYGLQSPGASPAVLMAGTFVEARIAGREYKGLVALPRVAVESEGNVWIVNDEDRLEMRPVDVLYRGKEYIYVRSGLQDGDRVLVTTLDNRVEGLHVKVQGVPSGDEASAAPPWRDAQ